MVGDGKVTEGGRTKNERRGGSCCEERWTMVAMRKRKYPQYTIGKVVRSGVKSKLGITIQEMSKPKINK